MCPLLAREPEERLRLVGEVEVWFGWGFNRGEGRRLRTARPAIEAVLDTQTPEGYWPKEGKPWITVPAEQCAWLTEISHLLREGVKG